MAIRIPVYGPVQRLICMVLAASMASAPSMNLWAQINGTVQVTVQTKAPAPVGMIDTTYVTPGAVALAVLRPAQLMKSRMGELLPVEVATAAGLKYLGIDPANVEEVTGFIEVSNPTLPTFGITIKSSQPLSASNLPPELRAHAQADQLNGKPYLKSQQPVLPSFYSPDENTLIIAHEQTMKLLVDNAAKPKTGQLIDRVHKVAAGSDIYVVVDAAALRPFIQMGIAEAASEIPPDAKPFVDASKLVSAVELTVNLSNPAPTELVVHANDAGAAEQIEGVLNDAVEKAREQLRADLVPQMTSGDPVERAFAQYMERVSGRWAKPLMPKRDGAKFTLFRLDGANSAQQQLATVTLMGAIVALLLPATHAAKEAAQRNESMNNLKQMALALLNYESAKRTLPAQAIYDRDGKPLLSWRVQILPYIEEMALYNQFHLDEPWDSEHNKPLIARMPHVYANPNLKLEDGKTSYLALVGKECAFDGTEKGVRFQQVTDGTSRTIALVEADANKAVEWTKPDDLKFDANNPTAGLGHVRPGVWLAVFLDGHVEAISNSIDTTVLKAMMTKAGGEAVQAP
jgi:hypothetical protein